MSAETERQLIDRAELVKIIEKKHAENERLQAELAECQQHRDDHLRSWNKSANVATALALRVKKLEDAVSWVKLIFTDGTLAQERDPELWLPSVNEALSDSDRTADEVIAEYEREKWGEPVGEMSAGTFVHWANDLVPACGTPLYAAAPQYAASPVGEKGSE